MFISNGAEVVVLGEGHIVIDGGQFKNDGDFSAGVGMLHMTGAASTANSTIGGTSVTIFNDLKIKFM